MIEDVVNLTSSVFSFLDELILAHTKYIQI
jgi:hypothetical protein